MIFFNVSRWLEDCPVLMSQINVPATIHFDGWIWLLISSAWETPTSTERSSTYSLGNPCHWLKWSLQSPTCLSTQHWIQSKVFIFRVSSPLGWAYLNIHTLLNEACEQFCPSGYLEFFYIMQEKTLWGAGVTLWDELSWKLMAMVNPICYSTIWDMVLWLAFSYRNRD